MEEMLFNAAQRGELNRCLSLLEDGVSQLPIHEMGGATPLFVAAQYGHAEVCGALLDAGATHVGIASASIIRYAMDGGSPLCVAAWACHEDVCRLLIDLGATFAQTTEGLTPLMFAAGATLYDLRMRSFAARCSADALSDESRASLCLLLLRCGATHIADNAGRTPLSHAAEAGFSRVCEMLLDQGATHEPDRWGASPLSFAARQGNADTCAVLLRRGATHEGDYRGCTPLMLAAMAGSRVLCELLVNNGADVHAVDHDGATALYYAVRFGDETSCAALLEQGADVNARTTDRDHWVGAGATALCAAAYSGKASVCKVLLCHGADTSVQLTTSAFRGADGATPLWIAAWSGHSEICQLLLRAGAESTLCVSGMSALEVAAVKKHVDAFTTLYRAGAHLRIRAPFHILKRVMLAFIRTRAYEGAVKILHANDAAREFVAMSEIRERTSCIGSFVVAMYVIAGGRPPSTCTLKAALLTLDRKARIRNSRSIQHLVELIVVLTGWSNRQLHGYFDGVPIQYSAERGRAIRAIWSARQLGVPFLPRVVLLRVLFGIYFYPFPTSWGFAFCNCAEKSA